MIGPSPGRRLAAACVLGSWVALGSPFTSSTCAQAENAGDSGTWHPGSSLFESLHEMTLERFPESSLPPELRESLQEPLLLRLPVIESSQWIHCGIAPREYAEFLAESGVRAWQLGLGVRPLPGGWPVRVYREGQELPSWDAESEFPGLHVWWNPRRQLLFALSEAPPPPLRVDCIVDPGASLGAFERRFLEGPQEAGKLSPAMLEQRRELAGESRPVILLPAPGALQTPPTKLQAGQLEVALAVLDQGYRRRDSFVEKARRISDGATFAIEVIEGNTTTRVFEHVVTARDVGRGFVTMHADLRPYRGKEISLRLVTEPGESGENWFDYGVWSGLRFRGEPRHPPAHPHVLLLDLDTLRADRLGCYGYQERPTSPRLDAWAAQHAVIFQNVTATATWTLPSTASMMTGLAIHQHRVQQFPQALNKETPTLASMLQEQGYETFAIAEGGYVRPEFGFDQGFDIYFTGPHKRPNWSPAIEWLSRRRSERPAFVFLHTYLVHAPYEHNPRFEDPDFPYQGFLAGKDVGYDDVINPWLAGTLDLSPDDQAYVSRLYDALVARLDDLVVDFLEQLPALFGDEPWMVMITSDHGEEFFEHGKLGHGQSMYNELLRVPLLLAAPGLAPGVVEQPASTVDLVPTVLDLIGQDIPPHLPGLSLLGELPDDRVRVAQHSSSMHRCAVDFSNFKLIINHEDEHELYHLLSDPVEQQNVTGSASDTAQRLRDRLQRYYDRYRSLRIHVPSLSSTGAEAMEDLRALGYLGDE